MLFAIFCGRLWLTYWEFAHTVILFLKDEIVFGVTPKKALILQAMTRPASYQGPKLTILTRNLKEEQTSAFANRLLAQINQTVDQVSFFEKDKVDGELTQIILDGIRGRKIQITDMGPFFKAMQTVKGPFERQNMQVAADFANWTYKRIIKELESIIEDGAKVKHSHIQRKIEALVENDAAMEQFLAS